MKGLRLTAGCALRFGVPGVLTLAAQDLPTLSAQSSPEMRVSLRSNSLAPDVRSPQNVVERMLEMANLKPGETVYDLGSGDGRVLVMAAKKFGAKAVGIELSPTLVKTAEANLRKENLGPDQATVQQGDALEADFSKADVVVVYFLTEGNEKLRPRLEKLLKPGARVVAHDFEVRGWKPVKVEKTSAFNRPHTIYLYEKK